MRDPNNAFHIAIPCKDLQEALDFYEGKLGFENKRRYDDRVTFNMFGDQLVCHLSPDKIDTDAEPYPRHFGITFHKQSDFDSFVVLLEDNNVELLNPISTRFDNMPEVHQTFFLKDPSNNILEFKFYPNSEMMH
tara:strand:+ start:538 stop:939 length:402 start_codon:yes stop_codon:yes gene_type:complete